MVNKLRWILIIFVLPIVIACIPSFIAMYTDKYWVLCLWGISIPSGIATMLYVTEKFEKKW